MIQSMPINFKGMATDLSPSMDYTGLALEVQNMRFERDDQIDGNTSTYCWKTEKGDTLKCNSFAYTIDNVEHQILGKVVATYDTLVGILIFINNDNSSYIVLYKGGTDYKVLYAGEKCFDESIDIESSYENDCYYKIYFTTKAFGTHIINILDNALITDINKIRFFQDSNIEVNIEITRNALGKFPSGSVQYVVLLYNKYMSLYNKLYISDMYYIMNSRAGAPDETIECGFNIKIDISNNSIFNNYTLYGILYTSPGSQECYIVKEGEINSTISICDTYYNRTTYDLNKLLLVNAFSNFTANTFKIKDNTLLLGNIHKINNVPPFIESTIHYHNRMFWPDTEASGNAYKKEIKYEYKGETPLNRKEATFFMPYEKYYYGFVPIYKNGSIGNLIVNDNWYYIGGRYTGKSEEIVDRYGYASDDTVDVLGNEGFYVSLNVDNCTDVAYIRPVVHYPLPQERIVAACGISADIVFVKEELERPSDDGEYGFEKESRTQSRTMLPDAGFGNNSFAFYTSTDLKKLNDIRYFRSPDIELDDSFYCSAYTSTKEYTSHDIKKDAYDQSIVVSFSSALAAHSSKRIIPYTRYFMYKYLRVISDEAEYKSLNYRSQGPELRVPIFVWNGPQATNAPTSAEKSVIKRKHIYRYDSDLYTHVVVDSRDVREFNPTQSYKSHILYEGNSTVINRKLYYNDENYSEYNSTYSYNLLFGTSIDVVINGPESYPTYIFQGTSHNIIELPINYSYLKLPDNSIVNKSESQEEYYRRYSPIGVRYKTDSMIILEDINSELLNYSHCSDYVSSLSCVHKFLMNSSHAAIDIYTSTYYIGGKDIKINGNGVYTAVFNIGDTYLNKYNMLVSRPYSDNDVDIYSYIYNMLVFNRVGLHGTYSNSDELSKLEPVDSRKHIHKVNEAYSVNSIFNYRYTDPEISQEYPNSVLISNTRTIEDTVDTFASISLAASQLLPGEYGSITKLETVEDNLYCIQEKAVSRILFNEQVAIATSSQVPIEIANSGKWQGSKIIANIGNPDKTKIACSNTSLYIIDSILKSLYAIRGSEVKDIGLNTYCKSFIKDNYDSITLDYDIDKQSLLIITDNKTLAYDEFTGLFTSIYTRIRGHYSNFDSKEYIIYNNSFNTIFINSLRDSINSSLAGDENPVAYIKWLIPFKNDIIPFNINYLSNVFETKNIIVDNGRKLNYITNRTFNKIKVENEFQYGEKDINFAHGKATNAKKKFGEWKIEIPRDNKGKLDITSMVYPRNRIRSQWFYLTLEFSNYVNERLELYDINLTYMNTNVDKDYYEKQKMFNKLYS